MISFFTPEPPAPLGLDLSSLTGGGSCPAQFRGVTREGQGITCRYRHGRLAIALDVADGTHRVLMDHKIGPYGAGELSLGQLCRVAGLTVDGCLPEDAGPDLSGATSWFHLAQDLTVGTARMLVARLEALGWQPDGLDQPAFQLWHSDILLEGRYPGFAFPPRPKRALCHKIAAQRGLDLMPEARLSEEFSLLTSFATANGPARSVLQQLVDVAQDILPEVALEARDLETGARVAEHDQLRRMDPALVDWCRAAPQRYAWVFQEENGSRYIGRRPV